MENVINVIILLFFILGAIGFFIEPLHKKGEDILY